ncbi:MAG: hypothetical protein EHM89_09655 [Acidobacteria bacterium]|jgi:hypothetical protein|nr:MAG: hypothetical protein EHM89_09655 [Acidobacteriota bacterium]
MKDVSVSRVCSVPSAFITYVDLARKLEELEKKYDSQFRVVFDAIRELMAPGQIPEKRRIGFRPDDD